MNEKVAEINELRKQLEIKSGQLSERNQEILNIVERCSE